jgi:hypothetical protein
MVYLWFLLESKDGIDAEFLSLGLQANITLAGVSADIETVSVTNYQVFLWTVGSACHSAFDLSVWYISACAMCKAGGMLESMERFSHVGSYVVLIVVVITAIAASLAVILRASFNESEKEELGDLKNVTLGGEIDFVDTEPSSFRFLVTWSIEMALSLFVYNPIIGTILFSGILGCGRLYFFGGRPRDVMLEKRENEKLRRTMSPESFDDESIL